MLLITVMIMCSCICYWEEESKLSGMTDEARKKHEAKKSKQSWLTESKVLRAKFDIIYKRTKNAELLFLEKRKKNSWLPKPKMDKLTSGSIKLEAGPRNSLNSDDHIPCTCIMSRYIYIVLTRLLFWNRHLWESWISRQV